VPSANAEQVPAPFRLHIWQAPQLSVVQQTPSVQWLLEHWLLAVHAPPFAFFPSQVPGVVALPVQ